MISGGSKTLFRCYASEEKRELQLLAESVGRKGWSVIGRWEKIEALGTSVTKGIK